MLTIAHYYGLVVIIPGIPFRVCLPFTVIHGVCPFITEKDQTLAGLSQQCMASDTAWLRKSAPKTLRTRKDLGTVP
jgi:hypothetical protein